MIAYSSIVLLLLSGLYYTVTRINLNPNHHAGEQIDSFNGVTVYYNGGVNHITGRNLSQDGYNLGLKYQCVEFVKRYYYQFYQHKMPDSYGHAKDFYDQSIASGELNRKRNLLQFANGGEHPPQVGDILVFKASLLNRFGHVAIVSRVDAQQVEIIQQNPGPFAASRVQYPLTHKQQLWTIDQDRILGWLRKASP